MSLNLLPPELIVYIKKYTSFRIRRIFLLLHLYFNNIFNENHIYIRGNEFHSLNNKSKHDLYIFRNKQFFTYKYSNTFSMIHYAFSNDKKIYRIDVYDIYSKYLSLYNEKGNGEQLLVSIDRDNNYKIKILNIFSFLNGRFQKITDIYFRNNIIDFIQNLVIKNKELIDSCNSTYMMLLFGTQKYSRQFFI